MGYVNDKKWNKSELTIYTQGYVYIDNVPTNRNLTCLFTIFDFTHEDEKTYNNLEEFLND